MKSATLLTSLPPKTTRVVDGRDFGTVYQAACIASWSAAGFEVISLNSENEIVELQKFGYPVKYVVSSHPRPTIAEFLAEATHSTNELVGIINADCLWLGIPDFTRGILTGASEGLVMIERVNIDPASLLPTGQTCLGFDAFFFSRSSAARIQIDPELAVGQPWWDYWFPATFAVSGEALLRPQSPVIFHLDHPQGWSQERWLQFGRKFISEFGRLDGVGRSDFVAGVRDFQRRELIDRDDLGGFGDWCFNWLRDNSAFLSVSAEPTSAELFGRILVAVTNFDGMHANTLALAHARGELAELSALRAQLAVLFPGVTDLKGHLASLAGYEPLPRPQWLRRLKAALLRIRKSIPAILL